LKRNGINKETKVVERLKRVVVPREKTGKRREGRGERQVAF